MKKQALAQIVSAREAAKIIANKKGACPGACAFLHRFEML
jgi:hypothetical protein